MEGMVAASVEELLHLVDLDDFDPDERDTTHGLQNFLMRLCHLNFDPEDELDILSRLASKNPDYNIKDSHGRTALMHACIGRRLNIVQFVTSQCNDVTTQDNDGNTVLVYAIQSGDCDIVQHLLNSEVNTYGILSARNNLGLTALDFAKRSGNEFIIRLIEDNLPAHPAVKQLRNRKENRQPRLPPPALPTASKPLSSWPKGANTRVPFNHSKSLDTGEIITHRDPVSSKDYTNSVLSQCDSEPDLTVHDDDDDVTPRNNDVTPRNAESRRRTDPRKSLLPQITSRSAEQARGVDRRKCRRDSISLPDLRDLRGILVSSGTTTPISRTGSRLTLTSQESLSGSEDVFDEETPRDKEQQSFPPILSRRSQKQERTLPGFSRARKKSNSSEDLLYRSVQF